MRALCRCIVEHPYFERFIIGLILFNGVILGLETWRAAEAVYGEWFRWGNRAVVALFVLEAAMKITAVAPQYRRYFGDGWNLFDFSVVVASLIPITGETAAIARTVRLLRVLRLISVIPELRTIVATLMRTIPSMMHILLLMSILFYIYAIAGYHLFHEHDPRHWDHLGIALLTLFRIVTLDNWDDIVYPAMEIYPLAWIYFVSFIIIGTFVVINLFIAVILNNLEQVKSERLQEMTTPVTRDELLNELERTRQSLSRLEQRLKTVDGYGISDKRV